MGDFSQDNLGVVANDVHGTLVEDGNFIFHWDDGRFRKMVLTDNFGVFKKTGYVNRNWGKPKETWTNTETWLGKKAWGYRILNFNVTSKGPHNKYLNEEYSDLTYADQNFSD